MPSPSRIFGHLGWRPDLPDHRDLLYSAPAPILQALPSAVDLTPNFACYDQGRIGSCTANALAGAIEFDRIKSNQAPNFEPSRLFIYYNERLVEGAVANDAGAQLRDGIKVLAEYGVCSEASWPYDDTPAPSEGGPFPPGSKPATKPDDAAYTAATPFKIISYLRLTPSLSQLQGCLAAGFPFVFGFTVFSGWYEQAPPSTVIPLPGGDDHSVGGHAVMCVGYDNATGLFKIRNSWGVNTGDNGYFYMHYSYLTNSNLANDFWTIRTVED